MASASDEMRELTGMLRSEADRIRSAVADFRGGDQLESAPRPSLKA
jgi:hypothetical protein